MCVPDLPKTRPVDLRSVEARHPVDGEEELVSNSTPLPFFEDYIRAGAGVGAGERERSTLGHNCQKETHTHTHKEARTHTHTHTHTHGMTQNNAVLILMDRVNWTGKLSLKKHFKKSVKPTTQTL